ncbi:hypothetical protein ACIGO9_20385 [Nocardia asteroides]|uniref:hypothetical protein n=1 Tax=Nocardia asteroides TaxID=1824 RepID=UPI0037C9BF5E
MHEEKAIVLGMSLNDYQNDRYRGDYRYDDEGSKIDHQALGAVCAPDKVLMHAFSL